MLARGVKPRETFMAKTALVTGAGNRIGRAIASALGAAGWNVAVHYHKSRNQLKVWLLRLSGVVLEQLQSRLI